MNPFDMAQYLERARRQRSVPQGAFTLLPYTENTSPGDWSDLVYRGAPVTDDMFSRDLDTATPEMPYTDRDRRPLTTRWAARALQDAAAGLSRHEREKMAHMEQMRQMAARRAAQSYEAYARRREALMRNPMFGRVF